MSDGSLDYSSKESASGRVGGASTTASPPLQMGAIRVVKMKANFTWSDLAHRLTYVISAFAYRFRAVRGIVQAAAQRRTRGLEEQGRVRAPCCPGEGRRWVTLLAPAAGGGRKIASNDGE